MLNKNDIIRILRSQPADINLLLAYLDCDKKELDDVLNELVNSNEIKFNKERGTYSLIKGRKYINKNDILNCLSNKKYMFFDELVKTTGAKRQELIPILNELSNDQLIAHSKEYDVYSILKEAKITIKDAGYAFASVDGEEHDYYISPSYLNNAYNGDVCRIYVTNPFGKNIEAAIYDIVDRAHKYVIGKVKLKNYKRGSKLLLDSTMNDFPITVEIPFNSTNLEYVGSIVVADLTYKGSNVYAKVKDKLGHPDDPGIEISSIALEYGFDLNFTDSLKESLKSIPDEVLEEQKSNRRDFTMLKAITIDGDDSKDFDDAVYLEKLDNGNYSLFVFIADVSEYVTEGSELDEEALKRGTSVYLADRVIPMLPRKLSNGICSLNEGVLRLVLACIMEIDLKGRLVNYDICEGVIKSYHRMTYNNVNKILNGDEALIEEYDDIVKMLYDMKELSNIIRALRHKKGGIEFETVEYKYTLNPDGSPKSIERRERAEGEMLIEDFMLMANETVAYHMNIMNLPIVYRVHEKPDQEKLHQVFGQISSMNVSVKNTKNDIHPKQIQTLLESVSDNPNKEIINNMLLRSMMKAKYSADNLGHYGLAMNYYCHFTSPIRRYPDLMTHRTIKKLLLHPKDLESDIIKYNSIIPEIALRNSASERKAVDCERAVNDMLSAWYISKYINRRFKGIITSITSFGMFVTLDNGIEGLIAYRNMNGYFDYNESLMQASNGKDTYHLGDIVDIIVIYANKESRKIDFMLEEDYKKGDFYEGYLY